MKKIYLHQYLSKTGFFKSKKELYAAIKNSEIKVDEEIITNSLYQFRPGKKKVFFKSRELKIQDKKIYLLINKPEEYLSSRLTDNDIKQNKKSVFELIEKEKILDDNLKKTLFCVGRLDEDTSGLLLITNDGILGAKITDPDSNIKKTYLTVLEKPINQEEISALEKGTIINLEENGIISQYKTKPCKITQISQNKVKAEITEGKKRLVRRMFESIGNKVIQLARISIGRIKLEDLKLDKGKFILVEKDFITKNIH